MTRRASPCAGWTFRARGGGVEDVGFSFAPPPPSVSPPALLSASSEEQLRATFLRIAATALGSRSTACTESTASISSA